MKRESGFFQKAMVFLLTLAVLITSAFISPQEVAAKTPKNGIVFEQSKATLYAGEYTTIVPIEVYQNGKLMSWTTPGKPLDKKEFTYKSSNTKVATVNTKGVVTAKKKGTATITVASVYNKKVKSTFKLTVSKGTQKAKITLKKTKATIAVGKSTTISVKSTKGLSAKTVKYTSSNTKVAAVNSKGKVAGKKAGTATITVTSGVNKKVTAKFKVTVKTPDIIDTDYSPKGKAKIVLDKTSVTLAPEKSFSGFTLEEGPGGWYDAKEFAARPGLGAGITPAKIMVANQKKYGTAQIKIKSMTGLKSTAVTYKSSNTKVAAVDAMGRVTPKRAGTAVITVTSKANKKVKATYKVTVRNLVTSFEFAQYTNLKKQEPDLDASYISGVYHWRTVGVYPIPETADNRGYTLTSSDENVIKVLDDNEVAGVGYGTATLTLKSADGFCKYSWECTVSDKGTTCWGNVDFGN